jgi:hypothetical protein
MISSRRTIATIFQNSTRIGAKDSNVASIRRSHSGSSRKTILHCSCSSSSGINSSNNGGTTQRPYTTRSRQFVLHIGGMLGHFTHRTRLAHVQGMSLCQDAQAIRQGSSVALYGSRQAQITDTECQFVVTESIRSKQARTQGTRSTTTRFSCQNIPEETCFCFAHHETSRKHENVIINAIHLPDGIGNQDVNHHWLITPIGSRCIVHHVVVIDIVVRQDCHNRRPSTGGYHSIFHL